MSIVPSKHGRWRSLALPITAALALAACATATPYQPLRGSGGGFTEQRLQPDRYRVAFVGNDYTSRQRVENYLLYRAAELTVAGEAKEVMSCVIEVHRLEPGEAFRP